MSEHLLVRYCSPTLAGLKSGSLFNLHGDSKEEIVATVTYWNQQLNSKGVFVKLLRLQSTRGLIYVYRRKKLEKDLKAQGVKILLRDIGYPCMDLQAMLEHLSERIKKSREFPHEIGLFLGYPLEDVKGFIRHKGKNCKCLGCWKVYSNEDRALCLFERYNKCTRIYCRNFEEGMPIKRLTVFA